MKTATLVQENLVQFCPITNFYACSDGQHLLVTVKSVPQPPALIGPGGIRVVLLESHVPQGVDVFLADENAVVLDADGDEANGLTPLEVFDEDLTFEEALERLGYEITTPA